MISATKSGGFSLADVFPSCLNAVLGSQNTLRLAPVDKAVVVLADGLGLSALRARTGHARTLMAAHSKNAVLTAGFPTTTAAALATLTTGVQPGEHGLVGYQVLDSAHDRVVNQLTGWDDRLDPDTWQRCNTVFQTAAHVGVPGFAIGVERYRDTGFSRAVLRGADYRAANTMSDRLAVARDILDETDKAIVYVYVPELDQAGHSHGWQSPQWTERLELLDAAVGEFTGSLKANEGLLITADHGVIDVPQHQHVLFDTEPGLIDGIRHIAGEPRCLQLYFEPDASAEHRAVVTERWRQAESARSTVVTRNEAIAQRWFGDQVHPDVVPRIGDLLVAARKGIAYYDSRVKKNSGRTMVGQHGSLSTDETRVPLLRFGAFG